MAKAFQAKTLGLFMEAFLVSTGIVALAEMGDKTQIATVMLAAQYQAWFAVVAGTTLGMMLANAPVVWLGEAITRRVPLRLVHQVSAGIFALLGGARAVRLGPLSGTPSAERCPSWLDSGHRLLAPYTQGLRRFEPDCGRRPLNKRAKFS